MHFTSSEEELGSDENTQARIAVGGDTRGALRARTLPITAGRM